MKRFLVFSTINKLFTSIVYLLVFTTISSQDCFQASKANWGEDSLECRKNVSLYSEFMKQKVFPDAAKFWNKTQTFCPQYKPNLYKNGIYIYKKMAMEKKKTKSPELKLYVDTIYSIYDAWVTNFGNCNEIKADLAADIMALDASKGFPKAYALYKEVFDKSPQFTSYNDIRYFVYANKYMLKTKKIECDQFLENYETLSSICDANISKGNKADIYTLFKIFLNKEIIPCSSNDKLEEINFSKIENEDIEKLIDSIAKEREERENNIIYDVVEENPEFVGGSNKLYEYLGQNIRSPKAFKEEGIEGKVFVQFVVWKDGTIRDVKIVKGFHKDFDEEAERVVKSMPKWTPGKHRGTAVNARYTLPIRWNISKSRLQF